MTSLPALTTTLNLREDLKRSRGAAKAAVEKERAKGKWLQIFIQGWFQRWIQEQLKRLLALWGFPRLQRNQQETIKECLQKWTARCL